MISDEFFMVHLPFDGSMLGLDNWMGERQILTLSSH